MFDFKQLYVGGAVMALAEVVTLVIMVATRLRGSDAVRFKRVAGITRLPAARRLRRVQWNRLGLRKARDDDLSSGLSWSRDAV